MLIAILTDIHANREALDACVADALGNGAHRFIFLGDIVGYGADPVYCADQVASRVHDGAIALRGNHDDAIASGGRGMNRLAQEAIAWTSSQLTFAQRSFLATLPLMHSEGESLFVHADASAPQSWIYVSSKEDAQRSLTATKERLTFCGHVHHPQLYGKTAGNSVKEYVVEGDARLYFAPSARWLTVLGAVGQPRDGDPRACYGLFDPDEASLVMRRIVYDREKAAAKILAAGLPPTLATRLMVGS